MKHIIRLIVLAMFVGVVSCQEEDIRLGKGEVELSVESADSAIKTKKSKETMILSVGMKGGRVVLNHDYDIQLYILEDPVLVYSDTKSNVHATDWYKAVSERGKVTFEFEERKSGGGYSTDTLYACDLNLYGKIVIIPTDK